MKINDFLGRVPLEFVTDCLEALPGPDRKRLLHNHGCRVKMGPAALRRKARLKAEGKKLRKVLLDLDDIEETRGLLQGWLARRGPLIIALLDAWEIEHNGGFVEDFDWVEELPKEKVEASIATVREGEHKEHASDQALFTYFAYLELPCAEEILNFAEVFEAPASA